MTFTARTATSLVWALTADVAPRIQLTRVQPGPDGKPVVDTIATTLYPGDTVAGALNVRADDPTACTPSGTGYPSVTISGAVGLVA